jgi:hypothetical protein
MQGNGYEDLSRAIKSCELINTLLSEKGKGGTIKDSHLSLRFLQ